jgi:hypothetical protein
MRKLAALARAKIGRIACAGLFDERLKFCAAKADVSALALASPDHHAKALEAQRALKPIFSAKPTFNIAL